MPDINCLACGGSTRDWHDKVESDKTYSIRLCRECSCAFVLPRPDSAFIERLYRNDVEHPARIAPEDVAATDPAKGAAAVGFEDPGRIARRASMLAKGKDFLDIGAGEGLYSAAAQQLGFRVSAIEPSASARKVFHRTTGFEAEDGWLSREFAERNVGKFDVVLLSQVLEHLLEPEEAAACISQLLRPGGVAVIGVPQFRSWLSRLMGRKDMFISPPYHINYFTRSGLRALFARCGMAEVFSESVTWFDDARVARRLGGEGRFGSAVGSTMVGGLRIFFRIADRFGGGNTLESYFRRV